MPIHGVAVRSFVLLVAITALSHFYRSCLSVIAPELALELAMSPQQLGEANGAFFLAMALAQVPVGMLFDRIGPRRTVSGLTALAVAAALWHAVVTSGAELAAARFLLGVGCAGSIMGAVTLCSRWCPGDRLSTVLSRIWAFGQVGIFLAATPLALASAALGWRGAFVAIALVTVAVGVSFHLWIEDRPPGEPAPAGPPESLRSIARGLAAVWRTPGLVPVLAIHTFSYASMATVLGLWAGPFLADVYHLDGPERGNVLLAMAVGQVAGILAYGPLDRIFDTRKWVIVAGALGTIGFLAALALTPRLPLAGAVALLVLFCGVTAYALVIVSHGRSLFPDPLVGRGVTTVNIAQVVGLTILAVVTGTIVGAFPAEGARAPEIAYRCAFGAIALAQAGGLAIYLFAKDSKPSAALGRTI